MLSLAFCSLLALPPIRSLSFVSSPRPVQVYLRGEGVCLITSVFYLQTPILYILTDSRIGATRLHGMPLLV